MNTHTTKLFSARLLEGNPYEYFELEYTKYTGWGVWLCSSAREQDPNRVVHARGFGDTPADACMAAINDYVSKQ